MVDKQMGSPKYNGEKNAETENPLGSAENGKTKEYHALLNLPESLPVQLQYKGYCHDASIFQSDLLGDECGKEWQCQRTNENRAFS